MKDVGTDHIAIESKQRKLTKRSAESGRPNKDRLDLLATLIDVVGC
jgi:hypothetical protein